jgi:hypothetical protein
MSLNHDVLLQVAHVTHPAHVTQPLNVHWGPHITQSSLNLAVQPAYVTCHLIRRCHTSLNLLLFFSALQVPHITQPAWFTHH